jgi:hypothetical protein
MGILSGHHPKSKFLAFTPLFHPVEHEHKAVLHLFT